MCFKRRRRHESQEENGYKESVRAKTLFERLCTDFRRYAKGVRVRWLFQGDKDVDGKIGYELG